MDREKAKKRKIKYFKRKYNNAPYVDCKCGCGRKIKNVDRYGRSKLYISGHNGRKYDDPRQFKREWNHRNRKSRYELRIRSFRRKKIKLVEMFGGKCNKPTCQLVYNGKNAPVFHFHHRDPKQKLFNIGNQLTNKSWKRIVTEAKKCDMICANCHEMEHSDEF
jgi:hypothetical protein